jgi:hypothetical protein
VIHELIPNKCSLCGSTSTYFNKSSNRYKWYKSNEENILCSFCYYKQYHKQVKDGTFQPYKEKIGLRMCSRCGTNKTQLTITRKGHPHRKWVSDGKGGYLCHNCAKKVLYFEREQQQTIKRLKTSNPRLLWAQMCIGNHKRNGFTMTLTRHELGELALKTDNCSICDVPLAWGYLNGKIQRHSPSLDRVNNELEITKDNVQILCSYCNRTKIARTMKEFIDYCKHVAKKYS